MMTMRQPAGATRQNERLHDETTRQREGGELRGDAQNNQPARREDEWAAQREDEETRQCDNKLAVALIWKPAKSCIRRQAGNDEKREAPHTLLGPDGND
jgi:hypothetical protein